jgi:hypothetical protein
MEHQTKNEDHQTKKYKVVNFWCTWMSEIPTKLEKIGRTSTLGHQGEEEPELSVKCWLGLGEKEGTRVYRRELVPAGATSRY